jgi:hypothetical protein
MIKAKPAQALFTVKALTTRAKWQALNLQGVGKLHISLLTIPLVVQFLKRQAAYIQTAELHHTLLLAVIDLQKIKNTAYLVAHAAI